MGAPMRAHGKEKEVPEAPPSTAELIGFRIINSLHVKQLVVDDPNVALYYREDEEGVRYFYGKERPTSGTTQKEKILYV